MPPLTEDLRGRPQAKRSPQLIILSWQRDVARTVTLPPAWTTVFFAVLVIVKHQARTCPSPKGPPFLPRAAFCSQCKQWEKGNLASV